MSVADCFAAGTAIATDRGEVPVEHLRPGDMAHTAGGGRAPVVWLGQRRLDILRHERPWDLYPVRVRAHAFAEGVPRRDVLLSPDHAIAIEGALVPVRCLLNDATIVQEPIRELTYWHVELPAHDVLLAEGLPAESYLDTGNRWAFDSGDGPSPEPPDFARSLWEEGGWAPLLTHGRRVAAAKASLLARLPALGFAATAEPDLRCEVDNVPQAPQLFGPWWCIGIPPDGGALVLRSRRIRPAASDPDSTDDRTLGIALTALRLDGEDAPLNHPRLLAGWHAPEAGLRWSDGEGLIDVADVSVVEFQIGQSVRFHVRSGDLAAGPGSAALP